ncbi:Pre-mRNA-processing factor 31 [Frankliniella fusca]|uniref:Pre-mRNA-processing factor 31 n=1 Tax=Frankliniella fusca TaxID=407009 RepID=A0AAE1LDX5_9NEOP|nr:Pre-mRNA-processing factor 31 [Frankliniella fusca]
MTQRKSMSAAQQHGEGEGFSLRWQRPRLPAAPEGPEVWGHHQDGAGGRYRVQEATADLHEALLRFYAAEFFHDEPVSRDLGLAADEVSAAEYSFMAAASLRQGASLVVLEERPEGAALAAEPEIVGGMILPVLSIHEELPEMQGRVVRIMMGLNLALRGSGPHCDPLAPTRTPPLQHYACDLGLWVRRDRRGRGLGSAILAAVPTVCATLGIPHFSTLFTSAQSQRLATKAGFKELTRLPYADVMDEEGRPAFSAQMPETHCALMGTDIDIK